MAKKNRIHWVFFALCAVCILSACASFDPSGNKAQIVRMAEHLNEKYGCSVSPEDCVYYRVEDYTYHSAFPYGIAYDIPHIGVFRHGEEFITVTDRQGFIGDSGQLSQVNHLICGYFEEMTGLDIDYVEVRRASNGNVADHVLSEVLHQKFNAKLTSENIDDFMNCLWENQDLWLELIFYFSADENADMQLGSITNRLYQISRFKNIRSLRFYVTDLEELNVYYRPPSVLSQTEQENRYESDETYVWGNYHVVNGIEYHYPIHEDANYQDVIHNTFLYGGFAMLNRGYSAGFGNREITKINSFGVVDLSDSALEDYLGFMKSYGNIRGYTILFDAGDLAQISSTTIASRVFRWGTGAVMLYAFKDGQLQELQTVYDCGLLTDEDIGVIWQRHREHFDANHNWDYNMGQ